MVIEYTAINKDGKEYTEQTDAYMHNGIVVFYDEEYRECYRDENDVTIIEGD